MTAVLRGPLQQYKAADRLDCPTCGWKRNRIAPSTARRAAVRHVQETGHNVVRINPRGQWFRLAPPELLSPAQGKVVG